MSSLFIDDLGVLLPLSLPSNFCHHPEGFRALRSRLVTSRFFGLQVLWFPGFLASLSPRTLAWNLHTNRHPLELSIAQNCYSISEIFNSILFAFDHNLLVPTIPESLTICIFFQPTPKEAGCHDLALAHTFLKAFTSSDHLPSLLPPPHSPISIPGGPSILSCSHTGSLVITETIYQWSLPLPGP